ncbi:MAG: macrocin O-methyltransferase [Opitutae bacterium]|nr:macrocin O-methyltransferase [Opitutae bacterium]|tara:strand:+ start:1560 stop:2276 length:717 start_codon:yes stop_codon:yes gene_type:complete
MGLLCKLFRKKKRPKLDNEHLLAGDLESIELGLRFSMSSWERLFANVQAVRYMVNAGLEGDVVECGVWRGGSMMTMAQTLLNLGDSSRNLHLYDTFSGMSAPVKEDGDFAIRKFDQLKTGEDQSDWCCAKLDEVKANLNQVGYPEEKLNFIRGKVEDTIPDNLPETIALLRLDMDWYEPTLHAMRHLFPRLQSKGVLIIDDYGHWEGCRQAVDDTLEEMGMHLLLNRTDYTGRIAIKP